MRWSESEDEFLINNYSSKSMAELYNHLQKRSLGAIQGRVAKLRQLGYKISHKSNKKVKNSPKLIKKEVKHGIFKEDMDLNLKMGQVYVIQDTKYTCGETYIFKGKVVLETDDFFTLKCNQGYCECFLKVDLLIGDYKVLRRV